jgi:hypothetical protein
MRALLLVLSWILITPLALPYAVLWRLLVGEPRRARELTRRRRGAG